MTSTPCVDINLIEESIKKRIKRYNGRQNVIHNKHYQFCFFQEIENSFGEKLIRIDGDIPTGI